MSLISWTYAGSNEQRASQDSGRQHAMSGDAVYDDELGKGLLDKVDGTKIWVEFGRSGEPKLVKERPAGQVYAVERRAPRTPGTKTGRCSSGMASIGSFFGSSSSTPQPTASLPVKRGGRGEKPFAAAKKPGRGRGRGRSSSPCGAADSGG